MKKKILIIAILLLALTFTMVACGDNSHLEGEAEVIINIERINNFPQDKQLTVATSDGELTYDGANLIKLKLKVIRLTKISISYTGYQTTVVSISAKEATDGKALTAQFGTHLSDYYNFSVINTDITDIKVITEGAVEIQLDNKNVSVKHTNIAESFKLTLSADNFNNTVLTNENIASNQSVLLSPIGTKAINVLSDYEVLLTDEYNNILKTSYKNSDKHIYFVKDSAQRLSLTVNGSTSHYYMSSFSDINNTINLKNDKNHVPITIDKKKLPVDFSPEKVYGYDKNNNFVGEINYSTYTPLQNILYIPNEVTRIVCYSINRSEKSYLIIDVKDLSTDLSDKIFTPITTLTHRMYGSINGYVNDFSIKYYHRNTPNEEDTTTLNAINGEIEVPIIYDNYYYYFTSEDNITSFYMNESDVILDGDKLVNVIKINEDLTLKFRIGSDYNSPYLKEILYNDRPLTPDELGYYTINITYNNSSSNPIFFNININGKIYTVADNYDGIIKNGKVYELKTPIALNALYSNEVIFLRKGQSVLARNVSVEGNTILSKYRYNNINRYTLKGNGEIKINVNDKVYNISEEKLKDESFIIIDLDSTTTEVYFMYRIEILEPSGIAASITNLKATTGNLFSIPDMGIFASRQAELSFLINNVECTLKVEDASKKHRFVFTDGKQLNSYNIALVDCETVILGDSIYNYRSPTIEENDAFAVNDYNITEVITTKTTLTMTCKYWDDTHYYYKNYESTITLPTKETVFDTFVYVYNRNSECVAKFDKNDSNRILLAL